MIRDVVREICALSVFCGVALSLTPEGSVKKITRLCAMALLLITALSAFRAPDHSTWQVELARYREMGQTLARDGESSRERLNRLVIEDECESYLKTRAAAMGHGELDVQITAAWDMDGFWVPKKAEIRGIAPEDRKLISELIKAELGIDEKDLTWVDENEP